MSITYKFKYQISIILLPIIYLLLFGRFGLEDSDSGFIVGLGWRVFNGEIPYKDFYFVRPIISVLISSLKISILPEFGQVLSMRLLNYYQLLFQVYLTIIAIEKFYDFSALKINKYLFTAISFIATSIGSFYFQWYTTDGIFLAVLGLVIIVLFNNKNLFYLILAGVFLCLSALTKQNFYIVPIIGFAFVFLQYGLKKFIVVLSGTFFTLLIYFTYFYINNLIDIYLSLTSNTPAVKELIWSGTMGYFHNTPYFFAFAVIPILTYSIMINFKKFITNQFRVIFIISTLLIILLNIFIIFEFGINYKFSYDRIIPIIIVIVFLHLIITKKEKLKNHYFLIAILGISWASSISWGYRSPHLYFTPIIFASYYLLQKYLNIFDKKTVVFFSSVILIYSFIANLKPYRDDYIWNITSDASKISSKLAFIKTNDMRLKKHLELKEIFNNYDNTTILPSMPGAYYIHGYINKLSVDWAMDVEIAYDRMGITNDLNNCCKYYIIEKRIGPNNRLTIGQRVGSEGKYYSSTTDYVKNNYKLIKSNYKYFEIYEK